MNNERKKVSDLVGRLRNHLALLAPHQKERMTGQLLIEATEEIERLQAAITTTLTDNAHLADGGNCTLIVLKRAMPPNDQALATASEKLPI